MSRKYIEVALSKLKDAVDNANRIIIDLERVAGKSCEEPKVLTAEEVVAYMVETYPHLKGNDIFDEVGRVMILDFFNKGHQNGRLERDIELRPLLEAVLNLYLKADHDGVSTYTQQVFDEFDNLPPLTKNA